MFKPVDPTTRVADLEKEVLAFWQEERIFQKSVEQNIGQELFVIYDGPPTANAKPPLHTIVPMSFKDAFGRFHTMLGKYVPRQVGWDTHGLPVEVQVEKAKGLSGKKEILSLVPGDEAASIAAFNEACRTSVWEFKKDWDRFVPRVGYWTDTENPYITYDPNYVEKVWGVFKEIWEKDYVYKDYKVVPYCPRCETALSAAEVAQEYHDTRDVSVFVAFPLKDQPERAFLAWTTTPWTLPGNVALALGPNITYVVVEVASEAGEKRQYILAKERLSILKEDYLILEERPGSELLGLSYEPLFGGVFGEDVPGKRYLTVAGDFVTTEDGTGIVHTACMYGEDDFQLGQHEGLTMEHTVGLNGHFLDRVEGLAGAYIRDGLGSILTHLKEGGKLYAKETITHSYPFCWRCKTALIYYAKDSWYIAMSQVRDALIASNEQIEWIPEHIKEGRFGDFIAEARDWAVSRERFWGTPLPVWSSPSGKRLCIGSIAELRQYAKDPSQIGEGFDPHRPLVDAIVLQYEGEEYTREPYVLDVWFDSGSMPYASGREAKGEFPADFIAEAIDQTRGWFYTLVAIGTLLRQRAPFKRVICMGHLVDEQGKKMSKSVGNVMDPWETFSQVGVDAVRWFIYTVNSPGESKAISIKEIQVAYRRALLPLRNVLNYLVTYAGVAGYESPANRTEYLKSAKLNVLDRWVLSRQDATVVQVGEYLKAYDCMRAGRVMEEYTTDVSTWYLRRSRKRTDAEFFTVLSTVLHTAARLIAPLAPYTAEYLYQQVKGEQEALSVHLQMWPEVQGFRDEKLEHAMETLRFAVELGMRERAEAKLKVRQPLQSLTLKGLSGEVTAMFSEELQSILADELNVKEVILSTAEGEIAHDPAAPVAVSFDLTLNDELIAEGRARELLRQLQNLRKQLGLQPGQQAILVAGPDQRSVLEPLLTAYPHVLKDAFLIVGSETWNELGTEEINLDDVVIPVSLRV